MGTKILMAAAKLNEDAWLFVLNEHMTGKLMFLDIWILLCVVVTTHDIFCEFILNL